MKQIYKNLYYDEDERMFLFADEFDRKQIVSQESYLLIYILENLINLKETGAFSLNSK